MKVSKYAKAIMAAVAAGAGAVATALTDDVITAAEWWSVGGAVAAALGLTWMVPNQGAGKHAAPGAGARE
jgi:hypothetical protein